MLTIDTIIIHTMPDRNEWFATFEDGMVMATPFMLAMPIEEVMEKIQALNPNSSVIQK